MVDGFSRLGSASPELAELLGRQAPNRLRETAIAVALWVQEIQPVADPRLASAASALRDDAVNAAVRQALMELVDELDEASWNLVERGSGDPPDPAMFARARAASCLWFALDDDPKRAAFESAYEAQAACGRERLETMLWRELTDEAGSGRD